MDLLRKNGIRIVPSEKPPVHKIESQKRGGAGQVLPAGREYEKVYVKKASALSTLHMLPGNCDENVVKK